LPVLAVSVTPVTKSYMRCGRAVAIGVAWVV